MQKLVLLIFSILVCFPVYSSDFKISLPKNCRREVTELLNQLSSIKRWRREAYAGVGTPAIYRTPTEGVGTWLEARVFHNKAASILLLQPEHTVKYSWAAQGCKLIKQEFSRNYNQVRLAKEFSDHTLIKKVEEKSSGVIYAWSPHMPLSMAGITPLREATKKLGIELILVLDPHADKNISIEMASKYSLEERDQRKLESVDLMLRGLGFHYPALIVYGNGKINDFALPGVKTSNEYQKLIARQLSSLREGK